jgi:hypothetical protein
MEPAEARFDNDVVKKLGGQSASVPLQNGGIQRKVVLCP